ncbi:MULTISPECIES: hypothetical protein [Bacillota]|uniref:hypothetical protein n=1 Tax=Bacillota TaxID=1239 RepID=UPI0039EF4BA4
MKEFLDFEHDMRFNKIYDEIPLESRKDPKCLSFAYLIAGNKELGKDLIPYISPNWERLDYGPEKSILSKEDSVLWDLAKELLEGYTSFDFKDIFFHLNERNLDLALNALKYKYNKRVNEIYEAGDYNSYLK